MFFFKQKTAYEMRISDWGSDVCSSDLPVHRPGRVGPVVVAGHHRRRAADDLADLALRQFLAFFVYDFGDVARRRATDRVQLVGELVRLKDEGRAALGHAIDFRSEEQTSELQSLMRISYAVFCLKK